MASQKLAKKSLKKRRFLGRFDNISLKTILIQAVLTNIWLARWHNNIILRNKISDAA
jgi:hypothetical protein